MEQKAKEIIVIILLSFVIVIINEKKDLGILTELVVLALFISFFIWNVMRKKNSKVYNYIATIYLFVLVMFSLLGQVGAAELISVFLFYTLLSKLFLRVKG